MLTEINAYCGKLLPCLISSLGNLADLPVYLQPFGNLVAAGTPASSSHCHAISSLGSSTQRTTAACMAQQML
jgi:hypothetical protein